MTEGLALIEMCHVENSNWGHQICPFMLRLPWVLVEHWSTHLDTLLKSRWRMWFHEMGWADLTSYPCHRGNPVPLLCLSVSLSGMAGGFCPFPFLHLATNWRMCPPHCLQLPLWLAFTFPATTSLFPECVTWVIRRESFRSINRTSEKHIYIWDVKYYFQ